MAFDARLSVRDRLTSSRPDAILVTPLPTKSKSPSTPHLQQVQHARSHGQVRRAHELKANKREVTPHRSEDCEDIGLDTSWRPLTNSTRVS